MKYTGRCLCENIKIEISEDFEETRICHCTRCQRKTGSAFHSAGFVNKKYVKIIDDKNYLKEYKRSERVINHFCSNCGTSLFGSNIEGDRYNIALGILDQPNDISIDKEIYTDTKASFLIDILKKHNLEE